MRNEAKKIDKMVKKLLPLVIILSGCGGGGGGGAASSAGQTPTSLPTLEAVGSLVTVTDSANFTHVLGELKNSGNAAATFVEQKCNFYDASQSLLATDSSYIVGANVKLDQSGLFDDSALNPGDVGYFDVTTTETPASYQCTPTYQVFAVSAPVAKLELAGTPSVKDDGFGSAEILGTVVNSGTSDLTFGHVTAVIRSTNGNLADIASSYINGDTVTLSNNITTDTALHVGGSGTFDILTSVPYADFGSYEAKFSWNDATITGGTAAMLSDGVFKMPHSISRKEYLDGIRILETFLPMNGDR